ncbi:MAG: methyltransferase domain-containing protein [Armatimonadia bacterium]|nr:methyltransferase domain-containing protein [Armatimonadia bacterium]
MSETGRDFTRDVAEYDAWYHSPWGSHAEAEELRLFLEMARPRSGERALDVGCGTGRMIARLLALGLDAHGAEPAREMRRAARGRLERAGRDPGRVVDAGAEALPFEANAFDLVTAITVLEFVDDVPAALREMARVCRGRLFICALNARSAYGARILRGEAGETLSRANLHSPEELAALVGGLIAPRQMDARTALVGGFTEDPLELAVQRQLDLRLQSARFARGGVIALVVEVRT